MHRRWRTTPLLRPKRVWGMWSELMRPQVALGLLHLKGTWDRLHVLTNQCMHGVSFIIGMNGERFAQEQR